MLVFLFSILAIIIGFFVAFPELVKKYPSMEGFEPAYQKLYPVLGIIALVIGIWWFINPDGDNASFVGDLIPSVLCTLSGLLMQDKLFQYIKFSLDPAEDAQKKQDILEKLNKSKLALGILTAIFGFLHLFAYDKWFL